MHCKGVHLKRLLEQMRTGHLATVSVILKSFNNVASLLTETGSVLYYSTEIRMEAVGLLCEMIEPSFSFMVSAHSFCCGVGNGHGFQRITETHHPQTETQSEQEYG